jgi:hypothetical protein
MSCNTDKFILSKSADNEFTLTIKQTGSTLPMEIIKDAIVTEVITVDKVTSYVAATGPTYEFTEEPTYEITSQGQNATVGTDEVSEETVLKITYTPAVEYDSVTAEDGTVTNNEIAQTIEISIDSDSQVAETHSLTYASDTTITADTHSINDIKNKIKELINADSLIVDCVLDNNELTLVGKSEIGPYTVNTTNELVMYLQTTVEYKPAIAGLDAIEPGVTVTCNTPTIVDGTVGYYTIDSEDILVSLQDIIDMYTGQDGTVTIATIKLILNQDINGISYNGSEVSYADGYEFNYVQGINEFTIIPLVDTEQYPTVDMIANYSIVIEAALTNANDTFVGEMYKLCDMSAVNIEIEISVINPKAGKLQVRIPKIAAGSYTVGSQDLLSERADKVDKYYLRPTYGIRIHCDTFNNGKFVAKIPEVHVE